MSWHYELFASFDSLRWARYYELFLSFFEAIFRLWPSQRGCLLYLIFASQAHITSSEPLSIFSYAEYFYSISKWHSYFMDTASSAPTDAADNIFTFIIFTLPQAVTGVLSFTSRASATPPFHYRFHATCDMPLHLLWNFEISFERRIRTKEMLSASVQTLLHYLHIFDGKFATMLSTFAKQILRKLQYTYNGIVRRHT